MNCSCENDFFSYYHVLSTDTSSLFPFLPLLGTQQPAVRIVLIALYGMTLFYHLALLIFDLRLQFETRLSGRIQWTASGRSKMQRKEDVNFCQVTW